MHPMSGWLVLWMGVHALCAYKVDAMIIPSQTIASSMSDDDATSLGSDIEVASMLSHESSLEGPSQGVIDTMAQMSVKDARESETLSDLDPLWDIPVIQEKSVRTVLFPSQPTTLSSADALIRTRQNSFRPYTPEDSPLRKPLTSQDPNYNPPKKSRHASLLDEVDVYSDPGYFLPTPEEMEQVEQPGSFLHLHDILKEMARGEESEFSTATSCGGYSSDYGQFEKEWFEDLEKEKKNLNCKKRIKFEVVEGDVPVRDENSKYQTPPGTPHSGRIKKFE